jgi:glycerol-3-phosphate dehydrogenase (NAD(P)+)
MCDVFILGAGSIGTALAQLCSNGTNNVFIWGRNQRIIDSINMDRLNCDYFPEVHLSNKITATNSFEFMSNCEIIFICVPSHAVRAVSSSIKPHISSESIVVNLAKGVEYPPLKRMSTVVQEELGEGHVIVMSGPNFADEIVCSKRTGTTLASTDRDSLMKLKTIVECDKFVVQTSTDIIGVELGGILKNVYSMAMGICDGLGVNENAYHFVFSQAVKEMYEIILCEGGRPESIFLSSGIGDLSLTASSNKSRNRTLGLLYGKSILSNGEGMNVVQEGRKSIAAVKGLCDEKGLNVPLIEFTYSVIREDKSPYSAFKDFWQNLGEQ